MMCTCIFEQKRQTKEIEGSHSDEKNETIQRYVQIKRDQAV